MPVISEPQNPPAHAVLQQEDVEASLVTRSDTPQRQEQSTTPFPLILKLLATTFVVTALALAASWPWWQGAGTKAGQGDHAGSPEREVQAWSSLGMPWQRSDRPRKTKKSLPHILLILADDYGWGNIGLHRRGPHATAAARQAAAEVHTPNLDALADDGVVLDRHYAYKICSPSRSSLQSGRLAVHVNTVNTGVTYRNPGDPVSGYAGIPVNMTGMAEKLKGAGYRTHMVGKWDAGMATPTQTPIGRGYDTFFGYYQHSNDYWQKGLPFESTGTLDNCLNKFVDFSLYNSTYRGGVNEAISREYGCLKDTAHSEKFPQMSSINATGCVNSSYCLPQGCFEEAMFRNRALSIIMSHETCKRRNPLFLFYAFHLMHTPLQIPETYLRRIDHLVRESGGHPIETQNRRYYAAMAYYMDEVVGDLVAALKTKKMYDDTLILFMADNGGPIYEPGAGNNHPLKGGKYSDWEGGVRTSAFVSGGYVPEHRRGKRFEGVVSIADWYGTLCEIAGVDQTDYTAKRANRWLAANGLPLLRPVDSVQQWRHIVGDTNGRPGPLHLSANAVLQWPYKLVTGTQPYSSWQGEVYPNCSTVKHYQADGPVFVDIHILGVDFYASNNAQEQARLSQETDCGAGCLYNVAEDPTEHTNLAQDGKHASKLAELQAALVAMNETNFDPDRGELDLAACQVSIGIGGYYGPFVDVRGYYSPVNFTMEERLFNLETRVNLTKLNITLSRDNEAGIKFLARALDVHNVIQKVPDKCYREANTSAHAGAPALLVARK